MKKIYFAALGVMMATVAVASENADAVAMETIFSSHKTQLKVAVKGQPRAAAMITAPQGRQVVTNYSGQGWYQGVQYLTAGKMEGVSDIIWDDDNKKVYIHTPIGAITDGYVVGDVSENGKTITVQLPQQISQATVSDNGKNYPMYLSVMVKTTDPTQAVINDQLGFSYAPAAADKNVVEYMVKSDGSLVMSSPYQADFERGTNNAIVWPEEYLSTYVTAPKNVFYDGGGSEEINEWFFYGNINQTIAPLGDDVVHYDIPANLNWEDNWAITGKNTMNSLCKVAIDGDKFYVGGVVTDTDAVLTGIISENTVTFKNNQMLCYDDYSGTYLFLQGVSIDDGYDELGYYCRYTLTGADMVFEWDKSTQTLTFQGANQGMLINYGMKKGQWYYGIYKEPVIKAQSAESLCVTPPVPKISQYFVATATKPIIVMAVFPREVGDDTLLSYDNLSFRLFLDGELLTFTPSDYGLTQDMTEIPCVFRSKGISAQGREATINLYDDGMNTIGIQTINSAPDGKKYYSDIHTYELGPDGIINPDGEIEPDVALKTITTNALESSVRYYDLQGRPVTNPATGSMVIKVTTFDDGSVRTTKTIR